MKLQEVLATHQCAKKHVERSISGTYSVSKANLSPGYYKDFKADDPTERSPFSTSTYWDFKDGLEKIASFAGEDGWEID